TTQNLDGVSCLTSVFCKAVASGGGLFSWNGSSWSFDTSVPNALYGVSCTTSTGCKAVGAGGTILAWNGTTWSADSSGTGSELDAGGPRLGLGQPPAPGRRPARRQLRGRGALQGRGAGGHGPLVERERLERRRLRHDQRSGRRQLPDGRVLQGGRPERHHPLL